MEQEAYEVIRLPDGTIQIEEGFVRSFLITGCDKALLIDTGNGVGNLKALCESLTELPITLLNTHADRDHVGCNRQFDSAFMHENDWGRARHSLPEEYPLLPVNDGDVFDLGGRRLEVLHLPGHTPGSIALIDRDHRILYSGDSVQNGSIFMFGEGRDMEQFRGSMQKLLEMKDCFDTVYPCHHGIPVSTDVIEPLLGGAEKALKGKLTGKPVDIHGTTVLLCDVGGPAFLLPES